MNEEAPIPIRMTDGIHNHATHLPILAREVVRCNGPIIEFGGGLYSTPVIVAVCDHLGHRCVTVEPDAEWAEKLRQFFPLHCVVHPEQAVEAIHQLRPRLAFIDSDPRESRKPNAVLASNYVDTIVSHDWHSTQFEIPGFKLTEVFDKIRIQTAVLRRCVE